nr:MAG TPA_asm: hypothetical protein [Caudoviricetes sp.]
MYLLCIIYKSLLEKIYKSNNKIVITFQIKNSFL